MPRTFAVKVTDQELLTTARYVRPSEHPLYCGIDTCARAHSNANLCKAHYQQFWKLRKRLNIMGRVAIDRSLAVQYAQPKIGWNLKASEAYCHVPGCKAPYGGRGLCKAHYKQYWKAMKEQNVKTNS